MKETTAHITIRTDWRKKHYKKIALKRGKAFMLDIVITMPLAMLTGVIVGADISDVLEFRLRSWQDQFVICIFSLAVYLFVCAIFESSKWLGTPGKRIMRMKTTDNEGNRISFGKALLRNFLRLAMGNLWLLIVPLSLLAQDAGNNFKWDKFDYTIALIALVISIPLMIFQAFFLKKNKKSIHDTISGTVVGERLTSY